MQEWIIAMLVISIMLIIRDMAKTFLKGRRPEEEIAAAICADHPRKEKIVRYAQAFRKLADTFYGMPYRKEYFSSGQVQKILDDVQEQVCSKCFQKDMCWNEYKKSMYAGGEAMVRAMEDGNEEEYFRLRGEWTEICGKYSLYIEVLKEEFRKEKQNLFWNNRMIENRLAVASQLAEISVILQQIADELYDFSEGEPIVCEKIRKQMKQKQILVKDIWMTEDQGGHRQFFLNLCTRKGKCIAVSEAARILSEICNCTFSAAAGNRKIINGEYHSILFVEDVSYQILYGAARLTSEEENVSGDNYICRQGDDGKFLICLSDGMGSGREACEESEKVVDLMEQFLDSGFSQEVAARMVNSAMLQSGREEMFTTLDVCAVDLYTGICSFLKAGAASTFIKRDHWVEVISSESLAAGIVQQSDFDRISKKIYHGDYIIMMTDGVLDSLPMEREEETMKEILMEIQEKDPKDISRGILERVLGYSDYRAKDDMTVLVAGMWKK